MINQPDQDTQGVQPPSGKLILPAPPEQGPQHANPYTIPIWPAQPMYPQQASAPQPAPQGFIGRQRAAWRKDPAYLVLSLAIALVLIATVSLVAFGATTLLNNNGLAYSQTPTAPRPSGTVDNKPNLPTPATNPGSNQSSQPTVGPTPNLQPTQNPMDQGSLSVQIVNVPSMVNNNSRVSVDILTNEPGVQVRLQVTYTAAPFMYSGGAHTTDDNGQATVPWSVKIYSFHNGPVQATVQVIATNQNGQQATSQAETVMIEG
jgi:hypothetical protein